VILFWLLFVILVAIALAFVLPPLWKSSDNTAEEQDSRNEANSALYREKISELEADLRNGITSQEQYQQDRDEIQRRLLEDVSPNEPTAKPLTASGEKRGVAYAVVIAFPLVALILYLKLGSPNALSASPTATSPSATTSAPVESGTGDMSQARIEANVASLAKRLEANPSDGAGWAMLARSYTSMEKYAESADAYAKATAIVDNNADLWAEYAFAAAMANGRQLQGKPSELIAKALKVDPENLKALELGGSAAFQAKDYKQAIDYWQRLLSKVPPDSEVGRSVTGRINEAKSLANIK
jgi:cytochrome c-type biogenesis protein CcmH